MPLMYGMSVKVEIWGGWLVWALSGRARRGKTYTPKGVEYSRYGEGDKDVLANDARKKKWPSGGNGGFHAGLSLIQQDKIVQP